MTDGTQRLLFLSQVSTAISSSLDADSALRRLARLVVPLLADWCAVDLFEGETSRRVTVVGRGIQRPLDDVPWVLGALPAESDASLVRTLLGAGPLLLTGFPTCGQARHTTRRTELEQFQRLGADTAILAPVGARGNTLGALTLVTNTPGRSLTKEDLPLIEDLAHRVGLAVDNARLYRLQEQMAQQMQLSLLPRLPDIAPLRVAARYAPARESSEVGGDWYDCFHLADGTPALVIGDIEGHDLQAAVHMSQIRNMTRALAWDRHGPPSEILSRLDQALHGIGPEIVTTMVLGHLTATTGRWRLHWTNAGHPPPLLVTRNGETKFLGGGHGHLLGADPQATRHNACEELPPDSTLLLYTDGLIERRTESLDRGMTRLRQQTITLSDLDIETFCDKLLAMTPANHEDDIAMIALRTPPPH
ncbi:MAG: DNA-binding protein [Pseudonocardiales bacterium]|nr:DNA-binding protein [Pseudonocardiales bacterium]